MISNKKVVNPGKGDVPKFEDGVKAIFHYRVQKLKTLDDGTKTISDEILDDSRQLWPHGYGQAMEIIYGKKFKLPIWEKCLETMRVDEIAEFTLEPKEIVDYPFVSKQLRDLAKGRAKHHGRHGHDHSQLHEHDDEEGGSGPCAFSCMGMMAQKGLGYEVLDSWLAKPEPLVFTFHLLNVLRPDEYEKESWALTPEQKLESIPQLKEEGNELFRQGNLKEAERKYGEALSRLDVLVLREKPGEPEWMVLDRQKVPFYLNLAQIKLKQQEYYAAVEAASEVLRREPENSKALFRRAKALAGVWNLDEARRDLDHLRRIDQSCAAMVEKELQLINELERKSKSDEIARFRNIFN